MRFEFAWAARAQPLTQWPSARSFLINL